MHRSEHWLATMADQLEAARAEIERLRDAMDSYRAYPTTEPK